MLVHRVDRLTHQFAQYPGKRFVVLTGQRCFALGQLTHPHRRMSQLMTDDPHAEIWPGQSHDGTLRMLLAGASQPFEAMTDAQRLGVLSALSSLLRRSAVLVLRG